MTAPDGPGSTIRDHPFVPGVPRELQRPGVRDVLYWQRCQHRKPDGTRCGLAMAAHATSTITNDPTFK